MDLYWCRHSCIYTAYDNTCFDPYTIIATTNISHDQIYTRLYMPYIKYAYSTILDRSQKQPVIAVLRVPCIKNDLLCFYYDLHRCLWARAHNSTASHHCTHTSWIQPTTSSSANKTTPALFAIIVRTILRSNTRAEHMRTTKIHKPVNLVVSWAPN